jgi:hypothetical protein
MTRHRKNTLSLALAAISFCFASGCRLMTKQDAPAVSEFSTMFGSPDGAYLADKIWDESAEAHFSKWIEQLGRERESGTCAKLGQCLTNRQANSLWSEDDKFLSVFADCTDAPLLLRAYFAFKTKRPFQYVSSVSGHRSSQENVPLEYKAFSDYKNMNALLQGISNDVHSGFFRMAPHIENGDTYPIHITPESVRPGTVFYDANGQSLIVYRVEKNGVIKLLSGHSDNSLSISPFGERLARGTSKEGGGFRAWRWVSIETVDAKEKKFRLARTPNQQSRFFDAEAQYKNEYLLNSNIKANYHTWIRSQLADHTAKSKPVEEFHDHLQSICNDLQERVSAVKKASEKGLTEQSHPNFLPNDIYAATGDWETYSTPSRDARIRAAFRGLYRFAQSTLAQRNEKAETLDFRGSSRMLAVAFRDSWNATAAKESCQFNYINTAGKSVTLTLDDVMNRVFDLSFDPYHCPEMRWGAKPARGASLATPDHATCPRDAKKEDWFWKESRLRNTIDREFDAPTPYDTGLTSPEDIHVPKMLNTLIATLSMTTTGVSALSQHAPKPDPTTSKVSAISPDGVDLGTLEQTCSQRTGKTRWECLEIRGCQFAADSNTCHTSPNMRQLIATARAAGKISDPTKPLVEEE